MDLELTTPDGKTMTPTPVETDPAAFAALQDKMRTEATGEPPAEAPAPPKRSERPEPPAEDKPRAKRGRPRKDPAEKARTTTTAAKAPASDSDFTEAAQGLVSGVWVIAAGLPPTQPYAELLYDKAEPLSAALAEGAKHSEGIRSWLTGSAEHAWKIQLASVAASIGIGALQLARDPDHRAAARKITQARLTEMSAATKPAAPAEAAPAAA